jgi:hypothetical protein
VTKRSLPAEITLDSLKRQAKALLKALHKGDALSLSRVAPYFPDSSGIGLQQIQLVIAREFGFPSWTRLKAHLQDPRPGHVANEQLADEFLSLATVSYFSGVAADPARFEQALALYEAHPEIAGESVHVAAALGDAERVGRFLDRQPQLVALKGGPYDWPPLLYAAYARVPGRSSLPAGRALIERGADPNACFLDDGRYRFTAVTGVFGQGEAGRIRQPEHPEYMAFARLLLDAGAAANDSQSLYNRMFEPGDSCLELLLEYGLSASDRNNWLDPETDAPGAFGQSVFDYHMAWALERRMPGRVRLLLEHGADVHRPIKGRTPYEWAVLTNELELAAHMLTMGAAAVPIRPVDRLYAAIMSEGESSREEDLPRLASIADPRETQRAHPDMLHEAVGAGAIGPVRRMLALGFDANFMTTRTPLHEAALHGNLEMARLLIDHGADTAIRDPHFQAPPIGWAEYNGEREMVRFLETQPMDVFAAAAYGRLDRLNAWLDADPSLIERPFGEFRARGRASPDRDWLTPLGFAIVNGRAEAVRLLLQRGASRLVRDAAGRSYADLARETQNHDILALLKPS